MAVLGVLGLAATGLILSGAQSAGAPQPAGLAPAAPVTSPIPSIPPNQDYGAYVLGRNTVAKAKTAIDIPTVLLRADTAVVIGKPYYTTDVDSWVLSPPGVAQRYGIFPALKTTVLAFGAIPVTATVHLQQLMKNNLLVPIHIHGRSLADSPYTTDPIVVKGQLSMTISDVSVDQVPLDVGTNCHTVSPLDLDLVGTPSNPPFPPKPGTYGVFTGGPLTGNTAIPAFTGCHNGSENLDALLTGMISGPKNPLHMSQGTLVSWTPPEGCAACSQPDPLPPRLH